MTAPHIFNATKINSQLLTGTMFILLSRGAECNIKEGFKWNDITREGTSIFTLSSK